MVEANRKGEELKTREEPILSPDPIINKTECFNNLINRNYSGIINPIPLFLFVFGSLFPLYATHSANMTVYPIAYIPQ
ncbi:hypothetical protein JCM15093_1769 [Bacteroides graminisolvens DSM 19988 = JCM 15093]|uniref:Uncharacterized protein n=1 Tax=Bacteroides graminisolvens DSM 19988 = JCM 15093 TaxID=1121097 RepID=A0A069D2H1_9BACE|nr:hypothetical protein JCM15093_1769 [Bacteroides graminisolvens DSM 19988 = JCM 15093]